MTGAAGRARAWGRAGLARLAPTLLESVSAVPRLRRETGRLRARVAELEEEVQECRRLHSRVAELTDIVAELLVPAVDRDDERVRQALDRYERSFG